MTKQAKTVIDFYRKHPEVFIEKRLGVKLWSGMRCVIESVWKHKRTSVRACHGISKTHVAAAIAVTFFNLYKDSIVITTAPTNRQVELLLWKEIRSIYARNGHFLRGECMQVKIKTATDSYMVGFSTDNAESIEGFHAPHILWILDEAKGLPKWLYDAVEGSLTGGFSRVLEISTTDGADQQCPFRQHHHKDRSAWNCIRLSAYDSPFVNQKLFPKEHRQFNTKLYSYGKDPEKREWPKELQAEIQITNEEDIKEKRELWETKRPDLWETKILGEFSTSGENNIIPLAWVQSAINAEVDDADSHVCYGLDVARMGNDMTVLTPKTGKVVQPQETWGKKNTMQTCGIVINQVERNQVVKVDSCGIGVGVFDRLAELGQAVIGIDSAAHAFEDDKFFNFRTELWWRARELFEQQYEEGNTISIPDDSELVEDLTGLKYSIKSDGRLFAEQKKEYKKRLGRSPDKGDSFVYTVFDPPGIEDQYYGESDDESDIFL